MRSLSESHEKTEGHENAARTVLLCAPARAAQACSPLLFGLPLDRIGTWAILVSTALCLAALGALFKLPAKPRGY